MYEPLKFESYKLILMYYLFLKQIIVEQVFELKILEID